MEINELKAKAIQGDYNAVVELENRIQSGLRVAKHYRRIKFYEDEKKVLALVADIQNFLALHA